MKFKFAISSFIAAAGIVGAFGGTALAAQAGTGTAVGEKVVVTAKQDTTDDIVWQSLPR
ncbi:hypothetical protein [Streptomyces hiroshimensis]|uniref:Uncharacterized protein n=1 Tax=Streptomyces hiroshimensis TaxID=66424 RepID=A0ABQ2YQF0_9ACTN|nr:hypothetical protein [Streptomyces hiroshimensis]GGX92043.1 hypothetical protein GCM10010324_42250 [Streptomyces hiroshimensis]